MKVDVVDRARRLATMQAKPLPPRWRTALLVLSVVAFAVMLVLAWQNRPHVDGGIGWWKLVAAAVLLAPTTMVLKATEYLAAAHLTDRRASFSDALDVSVMGSAANLLPVPGSMLVTTHSLSAGGATVGRSAFSTATIGVTWLAVSTSVGGTVIAITGHPFAGAITLAASVGLAATAVRMVFSSLPRGRRLNALALLVGIEVAFLVVAVARLNLVASGIGLDIEWWRMAAFPMAAAVGTAAALVPAGLGVREGLMALIAPAVGLTVAEGLLLGIVDRITWLVGLTLSTAGVLAMRALRRRSATP